MRALWAAAAAAGVAAAADPAVRLQAAAEPGALAAALRSAAAVLGTRPAEVALAPGVHTLSAPLSLPVGAHRLTLRGPRAGGARVSGGVAVTGWVRDADAPWRWRAPAPAGLSAISQLWVGGQRRIPARSPTMQYDGVGPAGASMSYITAKPGQLLAKYANVSALRVVKYEHWTASSHRVASVSGTRVTLAHPVAFHYSTDAASGKRYYLENAAEYLASGSGQFYHDEGAGVLLYAPTAAELGAGGTFTAEVMAPRLVELVSSSGVSDVHLADVAFEHAGVEWAACLSGDCMAQSASFLTTAALRWVNSTRIVLERVNVSHTGGYGVWFGEGVTDSLMSGCRVSDVGAGGVRIGEATGGQDQPGRLARNVTVADSVLADGGHVYREGCGVLMQAASGCGVVHNEIARFHYTGVSVGWTWNYVLTTESRNTVGWNNMHTIGMGDLSDMGCVYHLGYDPGTRIVNNICSNVTSYDYGGWGYYTDQASRFVEIRDNIAYNTKCSGFHQHYGIDNVLENNIFYNVNAGGCDAAVRSSAHASGEGATSSFTFRGNIVSWRVGPLFTATSWNSFANETFANNVYWNGAAGGITFPCPKPAPAGPAAAAGANMTGCSLASWRQRGQDTASVIADPLLTDPDRGDFSLRPGSPALKLGFKPIDTSSVGPRL
eukprot:TRINITY_DN3922_c0_g1_i1.p1 TRINITY_DN3922_c0_g1~~TRINITY_DN3922_c0_g1_i1.p1  ORF type:complete len:697 (+),score=175.02 TRINITY_DN3922_c0_g1_i1:103-2091(+)